MTAQAAEASTPSSRQLVIGGGCFWCIEASFRLVPGVLNAESGYSGGKIDNPSYRQVCDGDTGHAEVVRLTYDPAQVDLKTLFSLFWKVHNPTTLNRQGEDVGTQYRSVIYYADPEQKAAAEAAIAAEQAHWKEAIVTEVAPLQTFWRAEEYHQEYFRKNPNQGYCQAVVRTKVEKMRAALKH